MKVLHITDSLAFGGKERQLIELIKELSKNRVSNGVVVLSSVVRLDISDVPADFFLVRKNFKKDPSIIYQIFKICLRFKPDIVHAWDSMSAISSLIPAKMLGLRLINGMIRNAPEKLSWTVFWRFNIVNLFADIIIGNSKSGLNSYNAPIKKSEVIGNGFNLRRLHNLDSPNEIRRKLGINTKYIVGMVASFSNNKDYVTFVNACNIILNNGKDITFILVGDGNNLKEIINMVPINSRSFFIFTGAIKNVESVVNIFDIGILSTYTEGCSNSIIEYMALGKPVIATVCDGNKALITEGFNGFLFKHSDSNDLANKINILLCNNDLRSYMGRNSFKKIINELSIKAVSRKYLSLYSRLIK